MRWAVIWMVGLWVPSAFSAFYLPGVTPVEYPPKVGVRVKVNSMSSTKTAIPYDHYSLPFCTPEKDKTPKKQVGSFGEILWGDSIKPSPYVPIVLQNQSCVKVCTSTYTPAQMKKFNQRIDEQYRGHLILDNLPVSEVLKPKIRGYRTYSLGYPLGLSKQVALGRSSAHLHNHLALTIKYHRPSGFVSEDKGVRIVGFHVAPYSVKHEGKSSCTPDDTTWVPPSNNPVTMEDKEVTWSYSVQWIEDPDLAWISRWEPYLLPAETDTKIHWFSIVNSLLIILFLSGMVAMILLRSLHKDFNQYSDPDNVDEAQEERGWKLVHGDVFRAPKMPHMLAVYIGTGCQLLGMSMITIIFALLGVLSPANRGGLLTVMLLVFILLGSYAGYVSARLCKMFHVQSWKNTMITGTFFPGTLFAAFFCFDMMLWGKHAATAVPFGTIVALLALWMCVSLPLVFVGAVVGYRKGTIEPPVSTNPIPRVIPPQRWYLRPPFTILMAGVLPFGAAFIELFFILSSLWLNRFYYVFGFLAVVFVILTVTCAEITIVMVYFQLCYEDYQWWWRSFFISGSSGIHLFVYSIFYFFTTLRMKAFWSMVLYIGWMLVLSYTFAVITGTIGFLASLLFVRYIYSCIPVD